MQLIQHLPVALSLHCHIVATPHIASRLKRIYTNVKPNTFYNAIQNVIQNYVSQLKIANNTIKQSPIKMAIVKAVNTSCESNLIAHNPSIGIRKLNTRALIPLLFDALLNWYL